MANDKNNNTDTPDSEKLEAINSRIAKLETAAAIFKKNPEFKEYLKSKIRGIDLGYQSLFAYLAITALLVATAGVLFPYLTTKQLKEEARRASEDTRWARDAARDVEREVKQLRKEAQDAAQDAGQARQAAQDAADKAEGYLDKIKKHEEKAEYIAAKLAKIPVDEPLDQVGKQTVKEVLLDPSSSDRVKLLANALKAHDDKKWDDAVAYWKSLIILDTENAMAYFSLGNSLLALARFKGEEELFREAIEKYSEAVRIKPDGYKAYNNWGIALAELAKLKGEEELFREAFKKYAEAVRINSSSTVQKVKGLIYADSGLIFAVSLHYILDDFRAGGQF